MAQNLETGKPIPRITDWLKEGYVGYGNIDAVGPDHVEGGYYFKIGSLRFNTPFEPQFSPGDRVKIVIQKDQSQ